MKLRPASGRRPGPRAWLEADRQATGAVHVQRLARLPRLVARELEALHAFEQIRQGDPRLQPREWRPKAEVDPVPKCDMRVGIARDVEASGVAEVPGVAVRRADRCELTLAGRNHPAMKLNITPRHSGRPLERRAIAQHLLDRL